MVANSKPQIPAQQNSRAFFRITKYQPGNFYKESIARRIPEPEKAPNVTTELGELGALSC